jgi:hypothetical protein
MAIGSPISRRSPTRRNFRIIMKDGKIHKNTLGLFKNQGG